MSFTLAASMMCMNFLEAGDEIDILNSAVDWFHADIMDGHYCPNITLSPDFIASSLTRTKKPLEVHLMVTDQSYWVDVFTKMPVDMISVHGELINSNAFRLIRAIKDSGKKVGIVLNASTPLNYIDYYCNEIDRLTLMSVDVGYAGQKMVPSAVKKISQAVLYREEKKCHFDIQVDGCCNKSTYALYETAGANQLVMGSGLFGLDKDLKKAVSIMRQQQKEALQKVFCLEGGR